MGEFEGDLDGFSVDFEAWVSVVYGEKTGGELWGGGNPCVCVCGEERKK